MFSTIPFAEKEYFYTFTNWVGDGIFTPFYKPKGIKFINITVIGGGGKGGDGSNGGNGGAGGGSGGITKATFSASSLPDELFIAPAEAANPGGVFVKQYFDLASCIIWANGGGNASGSTAGTAAAAATAATMPYITMALSYSAIGGVAGAATGSVTALSSHILTGGAAGSSYLGGGGGNITGSGLIPTIAGGFYLSASLNGGNGVWFLNPLCGTGGAGGGGASYLGSVGGRGGNGAYGCGGGGGGMGYGAAGGAGGSGGRGIVYITCW